MIRLVDLVQVQLCRQSYMGKIKDLSKTFAFSCYKKGSENNNNNRKSIAHCLNVSDSHAFYLLLAVVQSEAMQESAVHDPFMI